jgi:hypothetical protein
MAGGLQMVTALHDVPGWQNTRWEMDSKQIIAAVGPELREVPRQQWGRFYSETSIPDVKIGAYSFFVVFQMDEGDRLAQVLIRHHTEDGDGESVAAFGAAKSQLSERFGTPERVETADEFHWSFPTTTISLSMIRGSLLSSMVFITFAPTANLKPKRSAAAF